MLIASTPLDVSDDEHGSYSTIYCIRLFEQSDKTKRRGSTVYWPIKCVFAYYFYEIHPFHFV